MSDNGKLLFRVILFTVLVFALCIITSGCSGCGEDSTGTGETGTHETAHTAGPATEKSDAVINDKTIGPIGSDAPATNNGTAPQKSTATLTVTDDAQAANTAGTASGINTAEATDIHTAVPQQTAAPTRKPTPTPDQTAAPTPTEKPRPQKLAIGKMPVLRITTAGNAAITSKDVYVSCKISSEGCPEEYLFTDSAAGIRIRGNSTAAAPKKPYRIKFETKQSLFGLNDGAKCKSWCLMADYFDPSMVRTSTALALADTLLEGKYYSSDYLHTEVYINGAYQGVYLICEQSQINKHRVNIYEKADTEANVSVGYLMIGQGGRTDEDNSMVVSINSVLRDLNGTELGIGGMNFSLASGDYTDAQIEYIEKWSSAVMKTVWSALYENVYYTVRADGSLVKKTDFKVGMTTAEKQRATVEAVVDIDSAVRMYILDEIVKNLDAGTFNMYVDLSSEGNHKLTFAAPWDFDFALGNTGYDTTHSTKGLYAANFSYSDGYRTNPVYVLLNYADWFREDVRKVWQECYDELLTRVGEINIISNGGKSRFADNYKKWDYLGQKVMFHQSDDVYNFKTQAEAAEFVYKWVAARLNWLNAQWGNGSTAGQLDLTAIDFAKDDISLFVKNFNCSYPTVTSNAMKVTVTDPHDPYFAVHYSESDVELSASSLKYLDITFMVPKSNSMSSYMMELFLAAGTTVAPEAGKSVFVELPADGEYHTYRLDLSGVTCWNGLIHMVRVDFFGSCNAGDSFYIKSMKLS